MPTRLCQCREQLKATHGTPNTRWASTTRALAAWANTLAWCSRISLLENLQCQVELFCRQGFGRMWMAPPPPPTSTPPPAGPGGRGVGRGRGLGRGWGGACLAVQFARGGAGCSMLLKSGVGEHAPQKLLRVTLMRPFHGNL